jgi:hypothetical protein
MLNDYFSSMFPTVTQTTLMENPTNFLPKLDNRNSNSDPFISGDDSDYVGPFNDTGNDYLEKMLNEDVFRIENAASDLEAIETGDILQEAMSHSSEAISLDLLKDDDDDVETYAPIFEKNTVLDKLQDKSPGLTNIINNAGALPGQYVSNNDNDAWHFPRIDDKQDVSSYTNNNHLNSSLDTSTLNLSLDNEGSVASSLRRKASNSQILTSKVGSAHKTSKTASQLRSNKSDGLLARALKQKYNFGSNLAYYKSSGSNDTIKLPGNALSAVGAGNGDVAFTSNSFTPSQHLTNMEKEHGSQNASWGTPPAARASRESSFSMFLGDNTKGMTKTRLVTHSTSDLKKDLNYGSTSSSRTSMQDILRLCKKQSKTQSALRQSSAQSLWKYRASNVFAGTNNMSSLLPPQHACDGGIRHISFNESNQSTPTSTPTTESTNLLHQSCRLYPTTPTVVDSALRIDLDAVRKFVPQVSEIGHTKKAQKAYGYPINIALSHGGSLEVLKMIAEAAPDILMEKDGIDGTGSLGIALMSSCEWTTINMLLRTNSDCIKVADRRGNYPLHVAAKHGISLGAAKQLYRLYPNALQMRNFLLQTPLDIAQRSTRCSEDVIDFLQTAAFTTLETRACRI